MSRPKATKHYPVEYTRALGYLEEHPTAEVVIHKETMAKVHDFRTDFNSFKAAAVGENWHKLYPNVATVMLKVKDNPPRAIICRRDQGEHARDLGAALAALEGTQPTHREPPQEVHVDELRPAYVFKEKNDD